MGSMAWQCSKGRNYVTPPLTKPCRTQPWESSSTHEAQGILALHEEEEEETEEERGEREGGEESKSETWKKRERRGEGGGVGVPGEAEVKGTGDTAATRQSEGQLSQGEARRTVSLSSTCRHEVRFLWLLAGCTALGKSNTSYAASIQAYSNNNIWLIECEAQSSALPCPGI